jgi:hypothetical protein
MRRALQEVDVFEGKLAAVPGFIADAHLFFDDSKRNEQLFDGFRIGAVEKGEKTLEIVPFGGEKGFPFPQTIMDISGKSRRKAIEETFLHQSLEIGADL